MHDEAQTLAFKALTALRDTDSRLDYWDEGMG